MRYIKHFFAGSVILLTALLAPAAQTNSLKSLIQQKVRLELTKPTQEGALFHWKITNGLDFGVFVYNFFLWGPPLFTERVQNHIIVNTTPVAEEPSCPPYRFPPVLLLVVGPHRTIEGDFSDPNITDAEGKQISMRIAVGEDVDSVIKEAKEFYNSECQHSPYDAIVRWGVIIESPPLGL